LSANAYNPYVGGEEEEYRGPKEILGEIKEGDKGLKQSIDDINKLL